MVDSALGVMMYGNRPVRKVVFNQCCVCAIATDRLSRMVLEHAWRLPEFVLPEKGEQHDMLKMVTLNPDCLVRWLVLSTDPTVSGRQKMTFRIASQHNRNQNSQTPYYCTSNYPRWSLTSGFRVECTFIRDRSVPLSELVQSSDETRFPPVSVASQNKI